MPPKTQAVVPYGASTSAAPAWTFDDVLVRQVEAAIGLDKSMAAIARETGLDESALVLGIHAVPDLARAKVAALNRKRVGMRDVVLEMAQDAIASLADIHQNTDLPAAARVAAAAKILEVAGLTGADASKIEDRYAGVKDAGQVAAEQLAAVGQALTEAIRAGTQKTPASENAGVIIDVTAI
jgi:hypothetical protein